MKTKALWIVLVAFMLAGCSGVMNASPTPIPTVVLGEINPAGVPAAPTSNDLSTGGGVRAAGIVVPAQEAQLSSAIGGNIQAMNVELGDPVQAGDVLVVLTGAEKLNAALQAANLELLSAQQALASLQDNAEQARAAAQVRLADAKKALDDAQKQRASRNYRNGSDSAVESAQADLILAKDALERAEEAYAGFADNGSEDIYRAQALSALSAARKAYDRAVANLNYIIAMPNEIAVDQAEAKLVAAQAEFDAAQAAFDKLQNGPDPEALSLAEARVENAQAQVQASQAALAELEIKAPFAGTVSKINNVAGEWAAPGQPVLALVNVNDLRVETTDLSERDVIKVQPGQAVTVLVSALGQEITGVVTDVSPLADTLGGDVVYQTHIQLDSQPESLRAGMSVDVFFDEAK
jgi:multidrug efflux pump subunit AcrA (membrane-fusion protein)